jgi:DNA-binding transcriptional MerR regulator/methylmalonyl-CoA mutase cobalamin-binding subunit
LTGLSAHTIRAWERRYGALEPDRTDSNRRMYGEKDIERLSLLRRVVEAGHSIGQVASLSTDRLRSLDQGEFSAATLQWTPPVSHSDRYLAGCLKSLHQLDSRGLEEGLHRGAATLGVFGLLTSVVVPLLHVIDVGWHSGEVSISQEHMASAVLRTFLDRTRLSLSSPPSAPRLLVTTPRNQHHEIGALMVAVIAALQSWNVTYLGPNLPADEIVAAARKCGASAIGLSFVFPEDDPELPGELRRLRSQLGPSIRIVAGGRATRSYEESLLEMGAEICESLEGLRDLLDRFAGGQAVLPI